MKKSNFKPKAVIFDMDGVIVDSMPYHFLSWYEALRPWGIRVNCFDIYCKEGENWEKTCKCVLRQAGIRPEPGIVRKIFSSRQKIFKHYFKRFIFEGAEEFLSYLKKKGYLLGLVTGTPKDEIKKILPPGIRNLFDSCLAGDEVRNGKPNPEPYLKAARMLKVQPWQCLVVENAPLGIESAKRAGMVCIGLTTSLPKAYLKKADIVVNGLRDITAIIDKSCKP